MKGQYRTTRHCPPDELPDWFEVLIDGVVYKFARSAFQPRSAMLADNSAVYNVFIEDGLKGVD